MVANGLSSDPLPVESEPVVDTCQTGPIKGIQSAAKVTPSSIFPFA